MKRIKVILLLVTVIVVACGVYYRRPLAQGVRLLLNRDLSHPSLSGDRDAARQCALAIHNVHDTRKAFPWSENVMSHLHPELSWRVVASSYMEQNSYYDLFRYDEPWNSAENQKGSTEFINHFKLSNGRLLSAIKSKVNSFSDLADGSSKTIMLLENPGTSGEFWLQPDDLGIDEAVELVEKIEPGDSLIAATYAGETIRIQSPLLTKVNRRQIRAALDPDDGIEFDLTLLTK